MNSSLLEELLNEDESTSLDFKRDQYPFVGADDDKKSELLKDILAFANSWRRTDAFILIGIEEVKGARGIVVGVADHLSDSDLQQFVNSKTQRPLTFSYEAVTFEGKQVGVIDIPLQERPLYLKKDFGKLKKDTVYIRRGSSTDIAKLDEISKMGITVTSPKGDSPKLELQFANIRTREELGNSITLASTIVEYDESKIPLIRTNAWDISAMTVNQSYKREKAKYIAKKSILRPVGFYLKNSGTALAANVHLEITGKREPGITILDEYKYPEAPRYDNYLGIKIPKIVKSQIKVRNHGENWSLTAQLGNIKPKAVIWSEDVFYVGANKPTILNLEATLFADNLTEPLHIPFVISIETKTRMLDVSELERGQ